MGFPSGERMNQRIRHIYERLEKKSLDALLVSSPHNITYLTEYISRDSYLLISQKKNIYFTDFRYTEEAKRYLSGFTIKKTDGSAFKIIAESCHRLKFKRIGFEESYLSFIQHRKMEEDLKHKAVLVPTHGLVEDLREIKTTQELK